MFTAFFVIIEHLLTILVLNLYKSISLPADVSEAAE